MSFGISFEIPDAVMALLPPMFKAIYNAILALVRRRRRRHARPSPHPSTSVTFPNLTLLHLITIRLRGRPPAPCCLPRQAALTARRTRQVEAMVTAVTELPPLITGIAALVEQCATFPDEAQAACEEAGLGPFEIPACVRPAARRSAY